MARTVPPSSFYRLSPSSPFFPTFPQEDFETEKDVIRREIDMGLDDP